MFDCSICHKTLKTRRSHVNHEIKCKEKYEKQQETLHCKICDKHFSRLSSRKRHEQQKEHIEATNALLSSGDHNTNTINNITNNINITVEIPKINKFGYDETQYLYNNKDFILRCVYQALPGLLKLIKAKNFNSKHPENKNIQKENKRDEFIKVYNGKTWQYKMKDDALEDLLRSTSIIADNIVDKYLEGDEFDDIAKLEGFKRDDFIKRIQGYIQILRLFDFPIGDEVIKTDISKDINKNKILRILDEFVYNHSDSNEILNNKILHLQEEINELKEKMRLLTKSK